jgi:L-threonylcarbamoyladenylate synthase
MSLLENMPETTKASIERAAEILSRGGVVGMPTETVYGLAASIRSDEGLQRIFAVKERPFFDPLIVHINALSQKDEVVREWPKTAAFLAEHFWPGPLTMVLPRNLNLNSLITAGLDTVGIRMPRHPIATHLIECTGAPIAAPSANKFGKTSPTTIDHVRNEFLKEDLFVLEGGHCDVGLESTVVGVTETGVQIYRPGMITKEILEREFSKAGLDINVTYQESPATPGHLKHHYQPAKPLVIVEKNTFSSTEIAKQLGIESNKFSELILADTSCVAARTLYKQLHDLSQSDADFLIVRKLPEHQLDSWTAIWDRLTRASSLTFS